MDHNHDKDRTAGGAGVIYKAAQLENQEVTEQELKEINKHTLEPLEASEVFTFAAVLCDNELDRQYEQFSFKALKELQKLFIGKTVIKDHYPTADNQVARIYATELVTTDKTLANGEPYVQLKAHCYMVKTESNKDLITEIKAGIKKEGSVGFRASSCICSICGTDNAKTYCRHWPGRSYEKEGGSTVCTFKLDGAKDAYEFSLVAVPAQRKAGVSKSYTGETVYEQTEQTEESAEPQTDEADKNKDAELALRLRARYLKTKTTKH